MWPKCPGQVEGGLPHTGHRSPGSIAPMCGSRGPPLTGSSSSYSLSVTSATLLSFLASSGLIIPNLIPSIT